MVIQFLSSLLRCRDKNKNLIPFLISFVGHGVVFGGLMLISLEEQVKEAFEPINVEIFSRAAPVSQSVESYTESHVSHEERFPEQRTFQDIKEEDTFKTTPMTPKKTLQKSSHKMEQNLAKYPSKNDATGGVGHDRATVIPIVMNAKYRNYSPPVYPKRARDMGQQGIVIFQVFVDSRGVKQEIKMIKSSGAVLLDESARTALKTWEFEPAHYQGQTVASWIQVPVKFMITQE